ncbi:MAG: hypothetical protein K6G23_03380 [Lachnospiraceae bacterium]|nr:hypothetical protein [Lachnospiraceae bacterium]
MDFTIFDIFIIACGAFLTYLGMQMKLKGEISEHLIAKSINLANANDKEGFIKVMFVPTLVIGFLTILMGVMDIINETYYQSTTYTLVAIIVFIVIMVGYCVLSVKMQRKYLNQDHKL